MKGWRGKTPHWLTLAAEAGGEEAERARDFVRAALRAGAGTVKGGAIKAGIAQRTFERAITRLGLEVEAEEIRHAAKLEAIQKKTPRKKRIDRGFRLLIAA